MSVEIPVGRLTAVVDDEDARLISGYTWYTKQNANIVYARTRIEKRFVYMHRLILPGVRLIDHANGNGLDNQRGNLRPCSASQNAANVGARVGTSRFKGVHRYQDRWRSSIRFEGKRHYIGTFTYELDAARAYEETARELYGEFAYVDEALQ